MKKSEMLTIARDRLQNSPNQYYAICLALPDVYKTKDILKKDELQNYISDALGEFAFAPGWLHAKINNLTYHEWYCKYDNFQKWRTDYKTEIRQWRIEWCNIMIQHFESIGE